MAKKEKKITAIESDAVAGAYHTIEAFFTNWGYRYSIKQLKKLLECSMSRKVTKANPSNVLYFFKTLKSLIHAVLLIHKSGYSREAAILSPPDTGLPDMSKYEAYCGMYISDTWTAFPRMLSRKEYFNPYIAFKKTSRFGNEEEWDFILDELQDYNFFKSSFAECSEVPNILTIQRLLQKLIEACYLLFTRTIKIKTWEKGELTDTSDDQIKEPAGSEEDENKEEQKNGCDKKAFNEATLYNRTT